LWKMWITSPAFVPGGCPAVLSRANSAAERPHILPIQTSSLPSMFKPHGMLSAGAAKASAAEMACGIGGALASVSPDRIRGGAAHLSPAPPPIPKSNRPLPIGVKTFLQLHPQSSESFSLLRTRNGARSSERRISNFSASKSQLDVRFER